MSTLIDINIPYASGSTNNISGTNHTNKNGFGWCWFGGDNGRKVFSLRMQEDESYWFVEVAEVDDLQASPMTKTVLYTHAINSLTEGLYATKNRVVEMCRLNSSSVYVKIFTDMIGNGNDSKHYVIEIDESNGNEVSVVDVSDQMPDWLRGGAYSYSNNDAYTSGRGVHHRFMHHLAENKILTFEASTQDNYGYGSLVERSWDPVTKSLTNRVVSSMNRSSTFRNNADYRTNPTYGYGDTWSFVPELDQNGYQVMRPSDTDPDRVSSYSGWPVLHGDDTDVRDSGDAYKNVRWFNVVTGRDGLVHICLATEYTSSSNAGNNHTWPDFNANMSVNEYVHTYNPADGSWGLTGRANDDTTLPRGGDDFGVFLPLNTMTTSDYATEESIDTSTFNGVTNSRVFKTWMFVGGDSAQVQGIEQGSPQTYPDMTHYPVQALQAIWLDYDHFMVIGWRTIDGSLSNNYYQQQIYSIHRYYDENKIETISNHFTYTQNDQNFSHTHCGGNIFQRPTANTLLSDRFGNALVTISAGSAPADSDGA